MWWNKALSKKKKKYTEYSTCFFLRYFNSCMIVPWWSMMARVYAPLRLLTCSQSVCLILMQWKDWSPWGYTIVLNITHGISGRCHETDLICFSSDEVEDGCIQLNRSMYILCDNGSSTEGLNGVLHQSFFWIASNYVPRVQPYFFGIRIYILRAYNKGTEADTYYYVVRLWVYIFGRSQRQLAVGSMWL
jgi:hypothetical protein